MILHDTYEVIHSFFESKILYKSGEKNVPSLASSIENLVRRKSSNFIIVQFQSKIREILYTLIQLY